MKITTLILVIVGIALNGVSIYRSNIWSYNKGAMDASAKISYDVVNWFKKCKSSEQLTVANPLGETSAFNCPNK